MKCLDDKQLSRPQQGVWISDDDPADVAMSNNWSDNTGVDLREGEAPINLNEIVWR